MAEIVFDVDGVLISSRNHDRSFRWSARLVSDLGVTEEVYNQIFRREDFYEILAGHNDFRAHISEVFTEHSLSLSATEFIEYWLTNDLTWNYSVLELASDLKSLGHSISIATNQDRIRADFLRGRPEIADRFDRLTASSDLGECKPAHAFYQKLSEQYFPDTQNTIVIDDDNRNILSASEVGFAAICFDPDLRSEHTPEWLRLELDKFL